MKQGLDDLNGRGNNKLELEKKKEHPLNFDGIGPRYFALFPYIH